MGGPSRFLRPEVRALAWRWREVLVTGALALLGVHLVGRGLERGSGSIAVIGFLLAGLGAFLVLFAILRLRLSGDGQAPGVVEVAEREIRYLSAAGGGIVSVEDLVAVDVVADTFGRRWRLACEDGTLLEIPFGAAGSERLVDALVALPGFRLESAAGALARARGVHRVWARGRMRLEGGN